MQKFSFHVLPLLAACMIAAGCGTINPPSPAQTAAPAIAAPSPAPDMRQVELANLRADIMVLDRRIREISIDMERLTAQNNNLSSQLEQLKRAQSAQPADAVSQAALDRALREQQARFDTAAIEQRRQIVAQVTRQIEELGRQTQAAIDAVARSAGARPGAVTQAPRPIPTFTDDFPREGIRYTVQRGDTLSSIAQRHNSTVRDIQNANQIADPRAIQVGQVIFIPQRSN